MSKKSLALIIPVVAVVLLGAIFINSQRETTTQLERSIQHLAPYEFRSTRSYAAEVLGQMGPAAQPAVPALLEALRDKEGIVCRAAAKALVNISSSPEVVSALIDCLEDSDCAAPTTILESLLLIAPPEQARPALIGALEHEKEQVCTAAAEALGEIGPLPGVVPALVECLQDSQCPARREVVHSLGQIGAPAQEAVPALQAATEEEDELVRLAAAKALWQITQQPEPALTMAIEVLKDEGCGSSRGWAAELVGDMGAAAQEAVPVLREVLSDEECPSREAIEEALQKIESAAHK